LCKLPSTVKRVRNVQLIFLDTFFTCYKTHRGSNRSM